MQTRLKYNLHNRHPRYLLSSLITTLVILLLIPQLSFSTLSNKEKRAAEKKKIEKNLEKYQINISRLEQRINSQIAQSEETVVQERNVLKELEEIDLLLQKQLYKVHELEEQVEEQRQLIEIKEKEIDQLQYEKELVRNHLRARISAYYKMGKIGFLNVAFSTSSLPELLNFHEAFQQMIAYDTSVLNDFKAKINDLEQARKVYVLEHDLLKDFIITTLSEKQETHRIRQEKKELLAEIRTRKQLYDKAVEEMKQATKQLSSSLNVLKTKKDYLDQEFKLSKGELPPPVKGTVITTFNQEIVNRLGITRKSPGIAIMAPDRTDVFAIADGTVIFSGYLRGYGNTVIIHHGFDYYTVTSRLGTIVAQKDQQLKSGDVVGQVGETAMLIDEGLYFEIRHKKKPQDPLLWLSKSNLQLSVDLLPKADG
ncbi:murein hydrolase activator EnvC [Desulfopila sp. IMCC35008]|uniref:murein hydrolase activator EnvC family protein n=1 Tax=Desulfopila sp. IMCC35008 TaxID=2653858 RepID=UPI0013CF8956|nr:peptidoglycan DD-metalloendopeptidase family protein [Desulfopila sp. IMCC35008]